MFFRGTSLFTTALHSVASPFVSNCSVLHENEGNPGAAARQRRFSRYERASVKKNISLLAKTRQHLRGSLSVPLHTLPAVDEWIFLFSSLCSRNAFPPPSERVNLAHGALFAYREALLAFWSRMRQRTVSLLFILEPLNHLGTIGRLLPVAQSRIPRRNPNSSLLVFRNFPRRFVPTPDGATHRRGNETGHRESFCVGYQPPQSL